VTGDFGKIKFSGKFVIFLGQAVVAQSVDSLRYKPESRGFLCLPVGYWDFALT
jgi:hypothetical protein